MLFSNRTGIFLHLSQSLLFRCTFRAAVGICGAFRCTVCVLCTAFCRCAVCSLCAAFCRCAVCSLCTAFRIRCAVCCTICALFRSIHCHGIQIIICDFQFIPCSLHGNIALFHPGVQLVAVYFSLALLHDGFFLAVRCFTIQNTT